MPSKWRIAKQLKHLKTFLPHQKPVATPSTQPSQTCKLLSLPPELVLCILEYLDRHQLIVFALTSHLSNKLASTILAQFMVISTKTIVIDRSSWPRGIRTILCYEGGIFAWEDRVPMPVQNFDILGQFLSLSELVISGEALVMGWDGLNALGRVLARRLTKLSIRMRNDPVMRQRTNQSRSIFTRVHSLHITTERMLGTGLVPLNHIREVFPNVGDLSIHIGDTSPWRGESMHYPFHLLFLSDAKRPTFHDETVHPVFPNLRSLHITTGHPYHTTPGPASIMSLFSFLEDHLQLEELTLPPAYPTQLEAAMTEINEKSPVMSRLRYLKTSYQLVQLLLPSCVPPLTKVVLDTIEDDCPLPSTNPPLSGNSNPIFPLVRSLELSPICINESLLAQFLTGLGECFPQLKDLALDLHRMSLPDAVSFSRNENLIALAKLHTKLQRIKVWIYRSLNPVVVYRIERSEGKVCVVEEGTPVLPSYTSLNWEDRGTIWSR